MSGASLTRRRIDECDRFACLATGCCAHRCGLLPVLAPLALEIKLIVLLVGYWFGLPDAAIYHW